MKWAISMLERLGLAALLSLALGIFPLNAWGQTDKLTLGQVSGDDISVLGLSSVAPGTSSHAIVFGDGSTVVIHSGKAHVKFEGGGELEICGPAKFTVLASGEALTIALSFGRVHARFDSSRPITIYTPLIVATPMAIGNQPRDTTFGLTNNGAMCLLATRGAVQVQQQLSGETLVVPQPSELLLQGTSLTATPALAESCRCDFDEAITQQAPSPAIASVEPEANTPGQPAVERKSAKTLEPQERQLQSSTAPAMRLSQQIAKIDLPPIGYDAKSPTEPAEALSVATLMLAKEADAQPAWIFHGTVTESANAEPSIPQAREHNMKRGFWARLHDLFVRSRK